MLPPAVRRALRELDDASAGPGIQLVRWTCSPWIVRWSLGSLPDLGLPAGELLRQPAALWTRVVPGDRDRLRAAFAGLRGASVLEYGVETSGVVRRVRESVRRVDPLDGSPALVSVLRDVTAARAFADDSPPPSAGIPSVVESGPLVLVVEDDAHVRDVVARILTRTGYGVLQAASAAEAVRLWERTPERIALVVADVILPDRPGTELARVLTRRDPALRTVFVSGYSTDDLDRRVRLPADAPFLSKPFRSQELARVVEQAMSRTGGGGAIEGPRSAV